MVEVRARRSGGRSKLVNGRISQDEKLIVVARPVRPSLPHAHHTDKALPGRQRTAHSPRLRVKLHAKPGLTPPTNLSQSSQDTPGLAPRLHRGTFRSVSSCSPQFTSSG